VSDIVRQVVVNDSVIGGPRLALIAGPCLIEDEDSTYEMAARLRDLTAELDIPFIFKASCDKANRTSIKSARGPGWRKGLQILAKVAHRAQVPVISDVHEAWQVSAAAEILHMLQIPALLSRQTDLLLAAGESGVPVNIKKGQFMAPEDMAHAVGKVTSTGNEDICLTERGTSFGYHNLVVDMRGLAIMRQLGRPVLFDATHSVQLPSGSGDVSDGQRELVPVLARAAIAVGVDGLFMEVHPDPDNAPCDGPNMVPMDELPALLKRLLRLREAVQDGEI